MCLLDVDQPPVQLYRTLLSNDHASLPGNNGSVLVEEFPLRNGVYTYNGYIAIPRAALANPAPVVLVLPNYAGLKQFDIDQITFLAQLGYVGVACDLYDNVKEYPYTLRNPGPGASKHELRAHIKGTYCKWESMKHVCKYPTSCLPMCRLLRGRASYLLLCFSE